MILLEMAQTWVRLADDAEANSATVAVLKASSAVTS
jgi:hypothetical protein